MKKSKSFYIIAALIILSVAGVAYMLFGPTTTERDLVETVGVEQLLEFSGADLHEEKDGVTVWKVDAEKIMYNPRTRDVFLTNAKVELNQDGTKLLIDAKKASITDNNNIITLIGHVEAKTKDGKEFIGEDVILNVKEQKLETQKSFQYKSDGMTVTGDTLTGDMVLNKIKVKGHVKVLEE